MYGRLCAADSASGRDVDDISTESPVFSNAEGTPTTSFRGLNVADLNVSNAEFSIVSSDAGNVDGFTQKGYMQWNFDRRKTDSNVNVDNSGVISATDTVFVVADGSAFSANTFIEVNDGSNPETMLITKVASNTLTVERAKGGTTAVQHANGADVFYVAMPEKRECIFASARPLKVIDSKTIMVDNPSIFKLHEESEFLIYIYDDSHSSPTSGFPRTVKISSISGREVSFSNSHGIVDSLDSTNNIDKILISPKRFWLMLEIYNFAESDRSRGAPLEVRLQYGAATRVIQADMNDSTTTVTLGNASQTTLNASVFGIGNVIEIDDEKMLITARDTSSNPNTLTVVRGYSDSTAAAHLSQRAIYTVARRYLPEKSYESAVMVDTSLGDSGTLGATFNESLYNDGHYINSWDLDPFTKTDNSAIKLADYGHGDFDEEKSEGGFLATKNLNIINDVNKYTELDLSGALETDNLITGNTLSFILALDDVEDAYKINIDTKHRTTASNVSNPMYFLTEFEDELPVVTDFKLQPNPEDAYNIDFTWSCESEDAWYGFIMLDDEKGISNQYSNSIIHLPLNEEGVDGADAGTITDNVGGIAVSAGGTTASKKPHYNIEGLAGYNLNFDGSDDYLQVGTTSDDCLSTVSDEFSVVAHIIHDDATVGSNGEYIIKKEGFELFIDQNEQVVAKLYSDANSALQLISIPMNIIVTFDSLLTEGNCKLFINGKLEDVSGVVVSSHGDTTDSTIKGWILGTDLHTADGIMFIGNETASASKAFDGKIEELVFYNKVLYPVHPKTGKFTLTKPLSELNASTNASSKSYSARLFVKDYHNIRGTTSQEVTASPVLNFRKAAFDIDAS